jgi:hypothetical protein
MLRFAKYFCRKNGRKILAILTPNAAIMQEMIIITLLLKKIANIAAWRVWWYRLRFRNLRLWVPIPGRVQGIGKLYLLRNAVTSWQFAFLLCRLKKNRGQAHLAHKKIVKERRSQFLGAILGFKSTEIVTITFAPWSSQTM